MPISCRTSKKMRLNHNLGIIEIESLIHFASNDDSDFDLRINPFQLRKTQRNQFMNCQLQTK